VCFDESRELKRQKARAKALRRADADVPRERVDATRELFACRLHRRFDRVRVGEQSLPLGS